MLNFILGIETVNFINTVDISKIKKGEKIIIERQLPDSTNSKINMIIIPIIPEGTKNISKELKESISIKQIYPAFKFKSSLSITPSLFNINFKNL